MQSIVIAARSVTVHALQDGVYSNKLSVSSGFCSPFS